MSDGVANEAEAAFLLSWLEGNREISNEWPANVVYERVGRMLSDGHLDSEEEGELVGLLLQLTGGDPKNFGAQSLSTRLPLSDPLPPIVVPGRRFCLTGKFLHGTREKCKSEIVDRGGSVVDGVVRELDYLVIGVIGSRDWLHSTHGKKIQKAVDYRERGVPISIVDERHFVSSLQL
jgi:NAD-dependent DNA ligase